MTFTGDRFVKVPSIKDAETSAKYFRPYLGKLVDYRAENMADRVKFRPLRQDLANLLLSTGKKRFRVLDVGAGPLTTLGCLMNGVSLEIVPVDALAGWYDCILADAGIDPPVKTIFGIMETLDLQFGPDIFDLAFSENAIDHCHDPMTALNAMMFVTKPGGWIACECYANEGEANKYNVFHQWNICEDGGRLVLWGKDKNRWDIANGLGAVETKIRMKDNGRGSLPVIEFMLRKPE